jgi:hypothetical protein
MKGAKAALILVVGVGLVLAAELFLHRAIAILVMLLYLPVAALVETVVRSLNNQRQNASESYQGLQ